MRPKPESVVFVVALAASVSAALLIAGPSSRPADAASPTPAAARCDLEAAVLPAVSRRCTTDLPEASSSPSASPSAAPTTTPTPRAAQPCLVSLHLPTTVRVGHALRIGVRASDACFAGGSRSVVMSLRRTVGHHRHVAVRWTAGTKPHDIVLRHGVPTAGHWELSIKHGTGLSALSTGTLLARR